MNALLSPLGLPLRGFSARLPYGNAPLPFKILDSRCKKVFLVHGFFAQRLIQTLDSF